jgi:phosphoribosylformylglycinamidine synthase
VTRVGVVDQGPQGEEAAIEVQDQFTVSLEDLRRTSEGVLPRLFG